MKHLQALLVLVLLAVSKRYQQQWRSTIDRVDTTLDAIEASQRRIEAMENGGSPPHEGAVGRTIPVSIESA
jgi:hypothetical protein